MNQPQPVDKILTPGNHEWGTERADPQGTMYRPIASIAEPTMQTIYQASSSLAGGPAVALNGTIYLVTEAGLLSAIGPDGSLIWEKDLGIRAVGSPAIDANGNIAIVGFDGDLVMLDRQGEELWRMRSTRNPATSGPVIGVDGTLYYTLMDSIQAVNNQGVPLWLARASRNYLETPPRLSPFGDLIFLGEGAIATANGQAMTFSIAQADARFSNPSYVIGPDGRTFFRASNALVEWALQNNDTVALQTTQLDDGGLSILLPYDSGVTPQQNFWMHYTDDFRDTRLIWIDVNGNVLANVTQPVRQSLVLGVDSESMAYVCGTSQGFPTCFAVRPNDDNPEWSIQLDQRGVVTGGALTRDGLYVATRSGTLYRIGEGF